MLVRDSPERFRTLVASTAAALTLDPSLVEKDYWVIEVLRALDVGSACATEGEARGPHVVFKGGTSLSKGYGLIERFSEDVDLLVPLLHPDGALPSQRSRMQSLVEVRERIGAALGQAGARSGGRRGIDLHWRFPYRSVVEAPETQAVEPSVLIELTVMGGSFPRAVRPVRSLVAEHAERFDGLSGYADLRPFPVVVLAPERTLVEKLALVHDAASRAIEGDATRIRGAGRHYYDIAKLLTDGGVREGLTRTSVKAMADDADRWSVHGRYPFTVRPADGFAASPAFNDAEVLSLAGRSYGQALPWVWGERLEFADCLMIVRSNAAIL
jgi:hypothetical protein